MKVALFFFFFFRCFPLLFETFRISVFVSPFLFVVLSFSYATPSCILTVRRRIQLHYYCFSLWTYKPEFIEDLCQHGIAVVTTGKKPEVLLSSVATFPAKYDFCSNDYTQRGLEQCEFATRNA